MQNRKRSSFNSKEMQNNKIFSRFSHPIFDDGGGAFSQEINNADNISSTTPTMEEINSAKNSLRNSVGDLQAKIKTAREENNKKITGGRLELMIGEALIKEREIKKKNILMKEYLQEVKIYF